MESLRAKTGVAFDKAYLSQMIAHHEAAVQMAKDILKATKNANTKRDADAVIASQAAQIARMTGWLRSWYKDAPLPAEVALVNKDMAGMMAMPADTDAMFYTMMIPHHQGAIDMSELALKNSGRAEVKALARKIIAEQRAEIAAYATKLPDG